MCFSRFDLPHYLKEMSHIICRTNSAKCRQRMNKHKFDIKHFPDIVTTVSEHFNLPGHSIKDFSFMPIERVTGNWNRFMKETS